MVDRRVREVSLQFLLHASRVKNPVSLGLLRERLFAGNPTDLLEWIRDLLRTGRFRLVVGGHPSENPALLLEELRSYRRDWSEVELEVLDLKDRR